ncbi:secreted aspartic protease [Aspergillus heteromorphus CBS 117.55]|uniref:Probable aspartic-type endopeptidase OPSB n=1 Tax=Aspergillus heteromorphus CBS 117.55 TaxID=1448321 RepID=A0A317WRN1_9EURO|nr:secreted aspartic protease [Aspergillus heteromorphus CBS 117.55]PWY86830.1 secreted aspartic protease [Aspergillus heteromorphus CBS 117.55]
MKSASALLLPLACFAHSAYSLTLHERDAPATLQFDIARRQAPGRAAYKRSTASADIVNLATNLGYTMNLTLGTPAQKVSVTLDTGSSDLWVNAGNSTTCPCEYGSYNLNTSSTYSYVNSDFEIEYVDGSGAYGDYVTDTLAFSNATLKNFQFAVAYESDSDEGVLGIGYTTDEASEEFDVSYKNLPRALVSQGIINSAAYSLWLDDLSSGEGSILFGGVNTAKYTGSLNTLPIVPEDGVYIEFAVNLTGVHLTKSGAAVTVNNTNSFPVAGVLDSGTALTYIPDGAAESIFNAVGAVYSSELGYALIECSVTKEDFEVIYEFDGFNMTVDISELVLDDDDGNICTFGISTQGDSDVLLGDTFLRSAYVVYDLANNEVSLAQANFDPGADHVLEIGSGSNSVPHDSGTGSNSSSKKSLAAMTRPDLTALVGGVVAVGMLLAL